MRNHTIDWLRDLIAINSINPSLVRGLPRACKVRGVEPRNRNILFGSSVIRDHPHTTSVALLLAMMRDHDEEHRRAVIALWAGKMDR
ncbi:MAG TPA: hypothetical protein VLL54_10105 [Pyrinomonadaceae bacterium]|nr:hypothetical protein [Pyrinomonadaceae bacterium]